MGEREQDYRSALGVRFSCDDNSMQAPSNTDDADGEWYNATCPSDMAVCGFRTAVVSDRGAEWDDTALGEMEVSCCPLKTKLRAALVKPTIVTVDKIDTVDESVWGNWSYCPSDSFVYGMSQRVAWLVSADASNPGSYYLILTTHY